MVDLAVVAFNFTLGVFAFFSPCGYPMLPAFVAYYLGSEERAEDARRRTPLATAARGLAGGALAGLGAFLVLAAVGSLAVAIGGPFKERILYLELVGGILVMGLGVATLAGKGLSFQPRVKAGSRRGLLALAGFGALYAAVAAGCVAPLFLGVVVDALAAPNLLVGFVYVASYAAGLAILLVALTVAVAVAGVGLAKRLNVVLPYVRWASGIVLLVVGAYLVWYWYSIEFLLTP